MTYLDILANVLITFVALAVILGFIFGGYVAVLYLIEERREIKKAAERAGVKKKKGIKKPEEIDVISAFNRLGVIYQDGLGVEKDLEVAQRYFEAAASLRQKDSDEIMAKAYEKYVKDKREEK